MKQSITRTIENVSIPLSKNTTSLYSHDYADNDNISPQYVAALY